MIAPPVPVFVVDDYEPFRKATAALLMTCDDFILAGEADSGEAAQPLIARTRGLLGGCIVLVDVDMPGIGGIEAVRRLRAAHPRHVLLLMSGHDASELPDDVATCGATAYVRKEDLSPDVLEQAWRARAD